MAPMLVSVSRVERVFRTKDLVALKSVSDAAIDRVEDYGGQLPDISTRLSTIEATSKEMAPSDPTDYG